MVSDPRFPVAVVGNSVDVRVPNATASPRRVVPSDCVLSSLIRFAGRRFSEVRVSLHVHGSQGPRVTSTKGCRQELQFALRDFMVSMPTQKLHQTGASPSFGIMARDLPSMYETLPGPC